MVKEPVTHEDGTVTVCYEVPAGHNECLELSKRITPEVRQCHICIYMAFATVDSRSRQCRIQG